MDKYLPLWRAHKDMPNLDTPEHQQKLVEEINKFADDENPEVVSHDEHDVSNSITSRLSEACWRGKVNGAGFQRSRNAA